MQRSLWRGVACTAFCLATIPGCAAPAPQNNDAPPAATAAPLSKGGGPGHATAETVVPLDKKIFGAAITEPTTTALTALATDPSKFGGKTVRTEGLVTAVCKAMGCWMEIGDDVGTAHIKMAGHAFFVPKTASGHRARVQGTVAAAPAENACKDGCGPDQMAKVEIDATGVEFLD